MSENIKSDLIELSVEEQRKRRSRNVAIAWVLVGLVVMFYVITVFKMSPK
jgi:predicted nucleic acid-binding Zn ribbon protein